MLRFMSIFSFISDEIKIGICVVFLYYHWRGNLPFGIKIYRLGTDPRENTFSERFTTKHALLPRV
jgi:hypothetical protein